MRKRYAKPPDSVMIANVGSLYLATPDYKTFFLALVVPSIRGANVNQMVTFELKSKRKQRRPPWV